MSELHLIQETLAAAARRWRWQQAWRGLWRGFFCGAVLWLAALVAYKIFPLPPQTLLAAGMLAIGATVAGFLVGFSRSVSAAEAARWLDHRQQLKERLSTALEVAERAPAGEWQQLVIRDAAAHVRQLDLRRLLPLQVPVLARWCLLTLVVAAGLGFVPEYRSQEHRQRQRDAAVIQAVGERVATLTKLQLTNRPPVLESTRQAMEAASEVGQQMQKARLTRDDALRRLATVTDKLKEQARELGQSPALQRLQQAARTPGGDTLPPAPDALQKQLQELQKAVGGELPERKALDQFKNDLEKLQKAAADLGSQTGESAEAMKKSLSEALSQLGQQADALGLKLPELEEAMAALAQGRPDQLLKDLNLALQDVAKMQQLAQLMQQLQLQAQQRGKDLGEQLERGQTQSAQASLQQMIDQLKAGQPASEDLAKMRREISGAVKPAGAYGQVARHLQDALQKMEQGKQGEAAQSLAQAQKELDELMRQMQDLDSLMAALQNLQKAQMCVGNCQGWGSQGAPRFGQGNKPGRGVGTWADEGSWFYSPQTMTELWDNSGIERPDMAAKGPTERGDGALNESLSPTKIKGQIGPGGSMPSITLKGISVKGASQVGFAEAAAAAQSAAESALAQDKVPRAYQGPVRDYFDDFKK